MSATTTYRCDNCGHEIPYEAAAQWGGFYLAKTGVAAGQHQWHACNAACASDFHVKVAKKLSDYASGA
jgi:hypothetical protein